MVKKKKAKKEVKPSERQLKETFWEIDLEYSRPKPAKVVANDEFPDGRFPGNDYY